VTWADEIQEKEVNKMNVNDLTAEDLGLYYLSIVQPKKYDGVKARFQTAESDLIYQVKAVRQPPEDEAIYGLFCETDGCERGPLGGEWCEHVEAAIEHKVDAIFWNMLRPAGIVVKSFLGGLKQDGTAFTILIGNFAELDRRSAKLNDTTRLGAFGELGSISTIRNLFSEYAYEYFSKEHRQKRTCQDCSSTVGEMIQEDDRLDLVTIYVSSKCYACTLTAQRKQQDAEEARRKYEELLADAGAYLADAAPETDSPSPALYEHRRGHILKNSKTSNRKDSAAEALQQLAALQDKSKVAKPGNPVPGGIQNTWTGNTHDTSPASMKIQMHEVNPSQVDPYNEQRVRDMLKKLGINNG
jgi:hypothetical protein